MQLFRRIAMKALNRTFTVSVASVLLCSLPGLLLVSKYLFWEHTNFFSFSNDKLDTFLFAIFALLCAFSAVIAVKYVVVQQADTHKQYFDLFENNPTPMAIVDKATQMFLVVNKASIKCYGYSASEFLLLKVTDIRIEEEHLVCAESKMCNIDQDCIVKHRKKDGQIIMTEISTNDVVFRNKNCRLLMARDITEVLKAREDKRIAEEENLKQKRFTAYVLENFPVDVAIFDRDHRYILINKVAVRNDEMRNWMIGKDDFEYFAHKGLDDTIPKQRRERFNKAVAGESSEWIDEHCINGETRYILRKFYPYKEDGELKYVYGYGTDITEVRKAHMQKDAYLEQLEKIAFTTSHKIRQPICNIQGLIALLEDANFDQQDLKKVIDCMSSSSRVLDDLTRDLAIKLHEYKQLLSAMGDEQV
jgi:PAS domain S-box-containing protein